MNELTNSFEVNSAEDMSAVGAELVARLKDRSTNAFVLLRGNLGAGKTTLVQKIAKLLNIAQPIQSPTFGSVHSYALSNGNLHHIDLYRRPIHPWEWEELTSEQNSIFCIEWSDLLNPQFIELLRAHHFKVIEVQIDVQEADTSSRIVQIAELCN